MTDSEWITHAANRGEVLVERDGSHIAATLIAWKPRNNRGSRRQIARVQFVSGSQASIPIARISLREMTHVE